METGTSSRIYDFDSGAAKGVRLGAHSPDKNPVLAVIVMLGREGARL